MGNVYLASMRLAVGLVCVGLSLILGGQWLGLIPDEDRLRARARAERCEIVAINAALQVNQDQWTQLKASLDSIVARDDDLLSIGLRTASGRLRCATADHARHWPEDAAAETRVDAIHVPLNLHRRQWGDVEFCFRPMTTGFWSGIVNHPLYRLLAYFAVAGVGAYTLVVARLMGALDKTQVVPDRVRQALDTLAEGLLVLDEDERIVLANRAFAETCQLTQGQLVGQPASSLAWVRSESAAPDAFPWIRSLEDEQATTDHRLPFQLPDGSHRVFSINSAPILTAGGKHRGALATFRDVTEIEEHRAQLETMLVMLKSSRDEISRKNQELEVLATQDALTGCLNRRAFFERFDAAWEHAANTGSPLACVMVDNDYFKNINDTHGHHAGDEVLRKVSAALRSLHCGDEAVCRYGGEEFCVLLPGKTLEQARQDAEAIREAIEAIRIPEVEELRLSASLGVSEIGHGASEPQALINQADTCLYVAKRNGRNQVVCYDPAMEEMEVDESLLSRTPAQAADAAPAIPFPAVTALLSALAFRDADTAAHSRRVADLCVAAGEGRLSHSETYVLEIAGLLHDIGKVGVPDEILLKPGPLTPEEWNTMGRHDRIGVEIVAGTFNSEPLADIIRTYQAHYGGGGRNPHLPQGDAIPVGARLLAIADSFDAMVSDRVYRKGKTAEEAFAELRRCSGTQFDPELVEHFIQRISDRSEMRQSPSSTISKTAALQIGLQMQRMAEALDARDIRGMAALAGRLRATASQARVVPILQLAEELEQLAGQESADMMDIIRLTTELFHLCRSTQEAFLPPSAQHPKSAN